MREYRASRIIEAANKVWKNNHELVQKGWEKILGEGEIASLLVQMLYATCNVNVRDYEKIKKYGVFFYTESVKSMVEEGLIEKDLIKTEKAFGPFYVDLNSFNTFPQSLPFFSRQLSLKIKNYLKENPLTKDGYITIIRMETGGMDLGVELWRQLKPQLSYKLWPSTPCFRKEKKVVESSQKEDLKNFIEGIIPSPEESNLIIVTEELINFGKTTSNATRLLRSYGYSSKSEVKIIAACEIFYKNPICFERLKRLGVDVVYLTTADVFFQSARNLGYITETEYQTVKDWLNDPIDFMKRVQEIIPSYTSGKPQSHQAP